MPNGVGGGVTKMGWWHCWHRYDGHSTEAWLWLSSSIIHVLTGAGNLLDV